MTQEQIITRAKAFFGDNAWFLIFRIKGNIIIEDIESKRKLIFADDKVIK